TRQRSRRCPQHPRTMHAQATARRVLARRVRRLTLEMPAPINDAPRRHDKGAIEHWRSNRMDGRIGAGGTHASMAKARKHHPRLAPVAHAVRIALAASAAAFALAGSGAAFAGEAGVVDDPSIIAAEAGVVDDPSIIAAEAGVALEVDAPVVEVGTGDLVGVYVDGGDDDAAVDNLTDIAVYSYDGLADGVFAAGDEVTVHNDGNIGAYAATWGAAIEAQGDTGAAVSNEGTLYAYGRDAFGIHASAIDGNVAVDNRGRIEAQGDRKSTRLNSSHVKSS